MLHRPPLLGSTLETKRFGSVTLEENSFDAAIANDVLEHIPNLTVAMTNLLRVLRPGGIFEILVPYDLSYGAWQDPTHVRARSMRRSWLYYCDWHWYLGWTEARFDIVSHEMIFTLSATSSERRARATRRYCARRAPSIRCGSVSGNAICKSPSDARPCAVSPVIAYARKTPSAPRARVGVVKSTISKRFPATPR